MSAETPPLISREEAARLLGTSERHLRRLIQQGHLPLETGANGTRGLRLQAVDELAARRRGAITQLEAANRLGCDRRTVRRMLDDGRLEAVPTLGGREHVALASVESYHTDTMGQEAIMGQEADTMGQVGQETDMMGQPLSHPVPRDPELVPLLDGSWPSKSDPVRPVRRRPSWRFSRRGLVRSTAVAAVVLLGLLTATVGPRLIDSQRATSVSELPAIHLDHRSPLRPINPRPSLHKPSPATRPASSSGVATRPRARGGMAELVSHRVRTRLRTEQTPTPTRPTYTTPRPSTPGPRTSVSGHVTTRTAAPVSDSVCADVYGPEGLC